jgi:hypothetical protein
VSSHFLGPLLAVLAEGGDWPVIDNPEYGWTALTARLARDLGQEGTFLPQQLKVLLAGLRALPRGELTIAAYERAGAAAGLEARFIEDSIEKVARLHGVTVAGVRAALLSLVNPTTGARTIEGRTDELLSRIDAAEPKRAQDALNALVLDEVVRRRVDPLTGESHWLLDHDCLARAVRQADRRAHGRR